MCIRDRVVDGREYWFGANAGPAHRRAPIAHLLPNFDEYTVGYRDRSALMPAARRFDPSLFSFGSILSNVVTVDGVVRGAWRRSSARSSMHIEVRLSEPLTEHETAAVTDAGRKMSGFLGRPVELVLTHR